VLQVVAGCCRLLQCVAVCCSVLQCIAVCYSVLQCVAGCRRLLQCVAVCCSVLQCVADDMCAMSKVASVHIKRVFVRSYKESVCAFIERECVCGSRGMAHT